jgi:hypothetical protein
MYFFSGDGLIKPKHVGKFIVYFNVYYNIWNQTGYALVRLIKEWINSTTPQCHVNGKNIFKHHVNALYLTRCEWPE